MCFLHVKEEDMQKGRAVSWDVFVLDLPREVKTISEIPDDFKPGPLGDRTSIIGQIKRIIPAADFSNPSWGVIDGDDWSIEVNMGDDEVCKSFAFHVRGGDTAAGVVAAILSGLNFRALDANRGDFFIVGDDALASFRKWRAYRDQVTKDDEI
jgi:hypothetical protein